MTVVIPVAILLTIVSAFFSASSTAVFSVGGSRLRTLVEEGFNGAKELSDLRSRTGFLQGILLLLGTLCNLSVVGLVTGWASLRWELQGFGIALPISALVILLFGEILPRSMAARRSIRVGLAVAPTVVRLERVVGPLLAPFFRLEHYLARAAGEEGTTHEERELREITSIGQEEGVVEVEEHQLVERAFRLDELSAWDVMIPRVDIFAWRDSLTLEDIVGELEGVQYSRVPVYGESVDDITGILYLRDAFQSYIEGKGAATLKEISRDPFFVPGSLSLTRLLKDFQARRIHLGIVADEFGGTDGLVTLEDLLEELVGEIEDETDLPEEALVHISETEVIADGGLDLRDINATLKLSLPQLEHRSLNGFIIEELGYVPETGETMESHGVRIEVVDASDTQVLRARIRKLSKGDSEAF